MGKITENDVFGGASDSDNEIKTENQYAKNYDVWRKKEELNKLKTKYGDVLEEGSESSSSSDDDEDAAELTEEVEKDFFKTLSYLKKKDPKIYDNNVSFFKAKPENPKKEKKAKDKPMFLKDYERKLLLEKGGILSDDEEVTHAKEQRQLKEDIIKSVATIESDDSDDEASGKLGGLLELRKKTKAEDDKEAEYLKWLTGQAEDIQDNEIKSQLKPLKEYWNNPNLDSGEKFLRDYVLKKRYLEKDDDNIPTYEEIIHNSSDDEEEIEKQEEFEHKYNFRFEEPDQDFIKRYPRTIEQSLRKTDDRRKVKRAETKERKRKEKEEKMEDIKKLQELKRKEIEEKIEKLKEVTGTTDLAFQDEDIEGDFDPEAHDRRMRALFNDEFYQGPEMDQKPEFPDIDRELEIENWDHWNGDENAEEYVEEHCEDEHFNMDADYNSGASLKDGLIESSKVRKKRKRKSKVAEALSRPKPKFDPNDKNYEKYFDEYYKLDCEDIIGDIPCRFKYRQVIPNDFGLSVEEILLAKDKELNRWCSLKKTVQRRPDNVEKYDQVAYSKKANDVALKRRLLPSLFSEDADEGQGAIKPSTSSVQQAEKDDLAAKPIEEKSDAIKKKKRKKKKKQGNTTTNNQVNKNDKEGNANNETTKSQTKDKKKTKKRKRADSEANKPGGKKTKNNKNATDIGISDARLSAFGINPKKYKNKLKYGNKN